MPFAVIRVAPTRFEERRRSIPSRSISRTYHIRIALPVPARLVSVMPAVPVTVPSAATRPVIRG